MTRYEVYNVTCGGVISHGWMSGPEAVADAKKRAEITGDVYTVTEVKRTIIFSTRKDWKR